CAPKLSYVRHGEEHSDEAIQKIQLDVHASLAMTDKNLCSDLEIMNKQTSFPIQYCLKKNLCFYLNISTLGAYKNDITQIIEHFLQDFHPVLCDQIITVVHEAVSNAIIWSNLEVGSAWNDEPTSIFDLGYFILKRLERKTLALRRIEIAFFWSQGYLSCCVSHQGIPFHWEKCKLDEHKPYKGLSIISSLSDHVFSSQDGQSFTVMFKQDKSYDGF
ncbi:MAG: hypothetical protein HYS39_00990, partial [Proteobacteria bacterium]|nr:hypothetical protein [Pseudomonadota bacterium]